MGAYRLLSFSWASKHCSTHLSLFCTICVALFFSCSIYNLQSKYFEAVGFLFFFSWGGASSVNSSQSQLMSRCRHFHKQTKSNLFLFSQAAVEIFFLVIWCAAKKGCEVSTTAT